MTTCLTATGLAVRQTAFPAPTAHARSPKTARGADEGRVVGRLATQTSFTEIYMAAPSFAAPKIKRRKAQEET